MFLLNLTSNLINYLWPGVFLGPSGTLLFAHTLLPGLYELMWLPLWMEGLLSALGVDCFGDSHAVLQQPDFIASYVFLSHLS